MQFVSLPPPTDVVTAAQASALAQELANRPAGWATRLALDTETTGLSIMRDFPLCWSLSDGVSRWFLDVQLLIDGWFDHLFTDPKREWVFANAKYDLHMLANVHAPIIRGRVYDVIGMSYMLDENAPAGLKAQAKRELGINMISFKEVFNIRSESDVPTRLLDPANRETVVAYATLDAYATWQLSETYRDRLEALPFGGELTGWDYYVDIEEPYTHCLWRMERRGFLVDPVRVHELIPEFEGARNAAERAIFREAGRPVNIRSAPQLRELFFGDLGLKPLKYTGAGQGSLDSDVLEKYAARGVAVAQHILDHRKYDRLVGTYLEGHCRDQLADDGRVHTTLRQFGTRTGRLSSAEPNMQNIPSKDPVGSKIREAFIADQGYTLGVWDYSTLEMRVMAHVSGDRQMGDAIASGLDLHCFTAGRMLGVSYEDAIAAKIADDLGLEDAQGITKKLVGKTGIDEAQAMDIVRKLDERRVDDLVRARTAAKTIGFGIMFGQGPSRLAETLGITKEQAQTRIDEWFATFPRVSSFIQHAHAEILKAPHELRTIIGRYRRVPEAASPQRAKQSQAQRVAVNTPIQGSAGDIVRLAMLQIDRDPVLGGASLDGGELGVRMVLQVHDEIICEVPNEHTADAEPRIVKHMQHPGIDLAVPLVVEGGYGANWKEAK